MQFSLLQRSAGDDFEQFFAIYEEALSPNERKSRRIIETIPYRADYRIILLWDDEKVIGFSILFISEVFPIALLEYMAIDRHLRGGGRGAALFKQSVDLVGDRWMIVEVDSDREESPDRALRIRRKQFYKRLGCFQIPMLDYLMPKVGQANPPVMDLLLHPRTGHCSFSRSELRSWLQAIYTSVYDVREGDPRIQKMLAPLPETIEMHPRGDGSDAQFN